MNSFINLVKINLKNTYSLNKQINTKSLKNYKLKRAGMVLLFIYLFVYLFAYAYIISKEMMKGLLLLNIPYILLTMFMVSISCLIIVNDVFRTNGNLFKTKDYDLLNSLPIKKSYIILSKLVTLYLENLIMTFMLMIPAFIVYVSSVSINITFIILFFITLFLIPIIPMIIATILGTFIAYISSLLKRKNLINVIFSLIMMVGIFALSFSSGNMDSNKLASFGINLVDKFNHIYPLTQTYLNIIKDSNILSFIIYLIIPIILIYIYLKIMNKTFVRINTRLYSNATRSNYKVSEQGVLSPFRALFKKDVKRFYSSYLYFLNCSMGVVFLTMAVVAMVIFGKDTVNKILETPMITQLFATATPLIIGAFCLLNSTTQCSISIEGKSLKILKSLPINTFNIFVSKILTNFTIFIPMIFINVTILSIYLKFSFLNYIVSLIVPLIYGLFIAMLGLIINLIFPVLEWDSEVRAIKQSMAAFLTVMIGMVLAILPIVVLVSIKNVNMNIFITVISVLLLGCCYLMYLYLKGRGIKRFNAL